MRVHYGLLFEAELNESGINILLWKFIQMVLEGNGRSRMSIVVGDDDKSALVWWHREI